MGAKIQKKSFKTSILKYFLSFFLLKKSNFNRKNKKNKKIIVVFKNNRIFALGNGKEGERAIMALFFIFIDFLWILNKKLKT